MSVNPISKELLIGWNPNYHAEHMVTDSDVAKANRLRHCIETSRRFHKPIPIAGDTILVFRADREKPYLGFLQLNDQYAPNAICTMPYVPFVWCGTSNSLHFSTSGGLWFGLDPRKDYLVHVGSHERRFAEWGHCGQRANGAFEFTARVNIWKIQTR